MAVNGGAHVLLGNDGADLLLGWDVLPGSSLLKGVEGKGGVTIHLRAGEELSSPAERVIWIGTLRQGKAIFLYSAVHTQMQFKVLYISLHTQSNFKDFKA